MPVCVIEEGEDLVKCTTILFQSLIIFSRIFRPENRNTNLFDILCQATHRRSPAKGRGRSRSRSVSPKKKTTTVQTARKPRSSKANARTSPRKSTAATPDVAVTEELPEEDMDPKPRAKKPKGKQKQVAGIVDVGDDEPKPKPRAKRAGSKKATTKAPRRTAKKATNDDPPDEDVDLATKAQKTRPKAKRKKQGRYYSKLTAPTVNQSCWFRC
ncbi:hypothetical protein P691DRAFT_373532 [Macrolepiota fuliginosa MF-IS2]|uniref:Uncharacterized protein n=1 Tax=Macrolepiota fuliginosa MF-IS2 TaxID=1400762 RepID=A0A9P5XJ59_9AGAR|nr:hypothetical protein P691DRAFT_373532 [Macrolepiota fuliginosa MF-IS2]